MTTTVTSIERIPATADAMEAIIINLDSAPTKEEMDILFSIPNVVLCF
jgi:hypothetical protein